MLAASSVVPRKPRADNVPRELRLLASRVVAAALEDALAGEPIDEAGLRPWVHLAGLRREKLPEVLARARRVVRGW
jgi:hypothetical protein